MNMTQKDRIKLAILERLTWTANTKMERFIYGAASSGRNFMIVDEEDIKEYIKDYVNSGEFGRSYTAITLSKIFNVPVSHVKRKTGIFLKQKLLSLLTEEEIYQLATQHRLGMPVSSKEILEIELDEKVYFIYFGVSLAS